MKKLSQDKIAALAKQGQRDMLEAAARISEGHYGDGHRLAEAIRALPIETI